MRVAFPCSLLFILLLFPLPPFLGCRLPSQTVALQSVAGGVRGRLWGGGSTLALLDYSKVIGRPASRLFRQPTSVVGGRLCVIQVR